MADYDPKVMQKCADRLYLRANTIIFSYGFMGLIFGLAWAFILSAVLGGRGSGGATGLDPELVRPVLWVGLPLLFLAFGVFLGIEKAFILKLTAQEVLCRLQTEANTARTADLVARFAPPAPPPQA